MRDVETVAGAVTLLFVPGDRPDRFAKAVGAGADGVIADLEDAVADDVKTRARGDLVQALGDNGMRALVRINGADTAWYRDDVQALRDLLDQGRSGLLGVVLPKASGGRAVAELRESLPGIALIPLIESAQGLLRAEEIAATPGVTRLAFGAIDFSLDVGGSQADRFLDHARSHLVVASRAAGIAAPLDSPSVETRDPGPVRASANLAKDFGFGGKLCIHPAQLAPVRDGFRPSAEERSWAESIVRAAASGAGATAVDGAMVDRPVLTRAQRILASPAD